MSPIIYALPFLLSLSTAALAADPAAPRPIDPGSWIGESDYPIPALRAHQEGNVAFEAIVDPEGKVTACTITASSGSPELDGATCEAVRARGRFEPARDGRGQAIASTWRSLIKWTLPPDAPDHFGAALDVWRYDLSPAGAITGCAEEGDNPAPIPDCQSILRFPRGAFLREMASRYRTIRFAHAFTPPFTRPRLTGRGWGERLGYRMAETVLSPQWTPYCTIRKQVGRVDILADLCTQAGPPARNAPRGHAGNTVRDEEAVYGEPRRP